MSRTVDHCVICGEKKPIVSNGRCHACNMQIERMPGDSPERFAVKKKKRDAKIRKALNGLIDNIQILEQEGYLCPVESIAVWQGLIAHMPLLLSLLKLHPPVTPDEKNANNDISSEEAEQEELRDSEVHSSQKRKVHVNSRVPDPNGRTFQL